MCTGLLSSVERLSPNTPALLLGYGGSSGGRVFKGERGHSVSRGVEHDPVVPLGIVQHVAVETQPTAGRVMQALHCRSPSADLASLLIRSLQRRLMSPSSPPTPAILPTTTDGVDLSPEVGLSPAGPSPKGYAGR